MKIDAWITKYLFTAGIQKISGEYDEEYKGMLVENKGKYTRYFHGNDWHRTEAAAMAHAIKMVTKKRKTIEKQAAALDALERSLKGGQ